MGDFIENYLQNEDLNIKSNNSSLILEVGIPGGSEYFNKQVLYINLKTKEPEKMEILNNEGNPKFIVTYNEFEWKK